MARARGSHFGRRPPGRGAGRLSTPEMGQLRQDIEEGRSRLARGLQGGALEVAEAPTGSAAELKSPPSCASVLDALGCGWRPRTWSAASTRSGTSDGCEGAIARPCRCRSAIRLWLPTMLATAAGALVYCLVPQAMVQRRLAMAPVSGLRAVLELGARDADGLKVWPRVDFVVPVEVLALPLLRYTASVYGLHGEISFLTPGSSNSSELAHLGTFDSDDVIHIDSAGDLHTSVGGVLSVDRLETLSQMVEGFVSKPNITLSFKAKVDIVARLWGVFPIPLYGIWISKSLTIPALDAFKDHPVSLNRLLSADGSPGELAVTATADIFNPTPITVVMRNECTMDLAFVEVDDVMAPLTRV